MSLAIISRKPSKSDGGEEKDVDAGIGGGGEEGRTIGGNVELGGLISLSNWLLMESS